MIAKGKPTTNTATESLFAAQTAALDAPDESAAEAKAFRDRRRILKKMSRGDKRRASIIAASVLNLCTA